MLIQKIKNLFFYKKTRDFYRKYERAIIPLTLVLGFVLDIVTFRTIQIVTSFVLLVIYIILVGASIAFINIYEARRLNISNRFIGYLRLSAPVVMQFSFGALLSMSFIFYSFGGAFSVSWPLVLTILFLMVANEIFKEYYKKPMAQLNVFFWCLLTLFFLMFPYAFNSLSAWVFVFGGVSAVFVMMLFVHTISKFSQDIKQIKKPLALYIIAIFGFMNALYFVNIVPPIPLAMREGGMYHNVKRAGGMYEVEAERETFFQKIMPGKIIHIIKNNPVYAYTAIFSPADLNTDIVHRWQKYNEATGKWVTMNKIFFSVVGGRKDGYRGYSLSTNVAPGRWRIYVETKRGQVLGKISFEAKSADNLPATEVLFK